jgi:hypothetical protein
MFIPFFEMPHIFTFFPMIPIGYHRKIQKYGQLQALLELGPHEVNPNVGSYVDKTGSLKLYFKTKIPTAKNPQLKKELLTSDRFVEESCVESIIVFFKICFPVTGAP